MGRKVLPMRQRVRALGSFMRVLLVSEPGVDGVFRHVEALAAFLLARGHGVDLAYSDVRGSDRLKQLVIALEAAGGQTLNLRVGNGPSLLDLRALMSLQAWVKKTRPEVIHAHSSKAGALVRALRFLGVPQPIFYTPHAYFGLADQGGLKSLLFNGVEVCLGRIGTTMNLSEGEMAFAREVLHVPQSALRLVANPVDTQHFFPAQAQRQRELKCALRVPEDALLLGSVGRLAFQKDPLTMYRAFALALKQCPQLWLYHLGEGELTTECEALAAKLGVAHRIVRQRYLSEPLAFYQALDGMILTSRYEGLSLAVLEALACDLPLILTEVPGNLDFVQMGLSHCWSAGKEDSAGMGSAIQSWVQDRAAARPCNHRETAERRFSQSACFGALVLEYEAALKRD
jgi:glycosyltransferase involved in cell wall biosynthesis